MATTSVCVRLGWLGAALAVVILAAACFGGDDPEPTPTATQAAVATPAPTPTPTPTPESTAAPVSGGSIEDLVITPSTTGQDLVDRLSEDERACLKSTFGDVFFGILLQTPLLGAGTDATSAAPLFGCLAIDSIVVLGISFIEAQAGGWEPDTRACMIGVGREHPEAVLLGMGMTSGEASQAAAAHPYTLELYNCLSVQEKVGFLLNYQEVIDSLTSAERDLIAALPDSDVACIREGTTEAEYQTILASTVHGAFAVSDTVAECVSPEGYVQAFVAITVSTGGPLTEGTASCLADFARDHPHYTALINAHAYDASAMSADELAEIADDGLKTWDCMTDEEVQRMQSLSLGALTGAP